MNNDDISGLYKHKTNEEKMNSMPERIFIDKDAIPAAGWTEYTKVAVGGDELRSDDFKRLVLALRDLAPFEIVTGDVIQRTNPSSRQMLNSTESWAVSHGSRAAHRVREAIETIHEVITK